MRLFCQYKRRYEMLRDDKHAQFTGIGTRIESTNLTSSTSLVDSPEDRDQEA